MNKEQLSITGDAERERALVAYGDTKSVGTFSGIPYFFLQAGRRNGLFRTGVTLRPERFRLRRMMWNALRPLTLDRPGGFMYSGAHLPGSVGRPPCAAAASAGARITSVAPAERGGPRAGELLHRRDDGANTSRSTDARLGRRIKVRGGGARKGGLPGLPFRRLHVARWCADDVEASYGISPEKVQVILPRREHRRSLRAGPDGLGRQLGLHSGSASSASIGKEKVDLSSSTWQRSSEDGAFG